MSWKSLKETVAEQAKTILRKGYSLRNTLTFDTASEVVDSVVINREILRKTVLKHLEDKTKNPLNDILGILGFRIIANREFEGEWFDRLENVDLKLDAFLDIDRTKLDEVLERAARAQLSLEQADEEEKASLQAQYDKLHAEFVEYQEKTRATLDEYQAREEAVANHVQYVMALRRLEQGASAGLDDCRTLLADMEMNAIWPDEVAPEERCSMFTVLKTGIEEGVGVKPCIMRDGSVFIKGIIIEAVE